MDFLENFKVRFEKICLVEKGKKVNFFGLCEKVTLFDGLFEECKVSCLKFSGNKEKVLEEAEKFLKDFLKVYEKVIKKIIVFQHMGKRFHLTLAIKDYYRPKPGLDFSSESLKKLYKKLLKTLTKFHYLSVPSSEYFCLSTETNSLLLLPSQEASSSPSKNYSSLLSTISELILSSSDPLSKDLNSLSFSIESFTCLESIFYSCFSSLPKEINSNHPLSLKLSKITSTYQLPLSHSGAVTSLAINENFSMIATGSISGEVQVWDFLKNEEICMIKPLSGAVYFLEFSRNSQVLISGGADQIVGLLSLKRKKILYKRKGHKSYMNCLSISPDSKFAVTGGDDAIVQLWDLQSCTLLHSLKGHGMDLKEGQNVLCCDINSKNLSVTGGADGYIKIWRLEWKCLEGSVTGHDQLVPYNERRGRPGGFEDFIKQQMIAAESRYDVINCVKILHNGQFFLSAGEDGVVRLWDLLMKEKLFEITAHRFGRFSGVRCLTVTKNDALVISGGVDGCLCFIDLKLRAQVFHQQVHCSAYNGGVSCLAVTPNDKLIIAGGSDASIVTVEIESKVITRYLKIHSNLVLGVKIVDDRKVISYGLDGLCQVWDPANGRVVFSLPERHKGFITAVIVVHLIREVVTGAFSGHLRFWSVDEKRLKSQKIAHFGNVSFLANTSEEKMFISGGSDGFVKVWHAATRICVQSLFCCQQSIINARMDARGKFIIAAGHKRKVYLCNLENGEVEHVEKHFRMIQIKRNSPEFAVFIEYLDY
jgi:WD40 repeat protein